MWLFFGTDILLNVFESAELPDRTNWGDFEVVHADVELNGGAIGAEMDAFVGAVVRISDGQVGKHTHIGHTTFHWERRPPQMRIGELFWLGCAEA